VALLVVETSVLRLDREVLMAKRRGKKKGGKKKGSKKRRRK